MTRVNFKKYTMKTSKKAWNEHEPTFRDSGNIVWLNDTAKSDTQARCD